MRKIKLGLLPRIILAIVAGIVCGLFFPDGLVRIFITINSLFGNFLGFIIPLLILGLVAPGIADLGKGAGRLLLITALLAYCFTLFSGFFTYFTCDFTYPWLLDTAETLTPLGEEEVKALTPYFTIEMPPLMGVMTSLILAFTLGLGMSVISGDKLKGMMEDFKDITAETARTNGERLYALYGMKGARGEALSGYATVLKTALPILKEELKKDRSINDAGVITLLSIIATSEDTNIVNRSSYEEMKELQARIQTVLKEKAHDTHELLTYAKELDAEMIERNISPGGSADLLALTYFIYLYEQEL